MEQKTMTENFDELTLARDETVPMDTPFRAIDTAEAEALPVNFPEKSNLFSGLQDSEPVIKNFNAIMNASVHLVELAQELNSSLAVYNWASAESEISTMRRYIEQIETICINQNDD